MNLAFMSKFRIINFNKVTDTFVIKKMPSDEKLAELSLRRKVIDGLRKFGTCFFRLRTKLNAISRELPFSRLS